MEVRTCEGSGKDYYRSQEARPSNSKVKNSPDFSETTCKSGAKEWMQSVRIKVLVNTARYQTNEYSDQVVSKELISDGYNLDQSGILYLYGLEKHTLVDQRNIYTLGLGLNAYNYEWFQNKLLTVLPGMGNDEVVLSFWFQVNDEEVQHARSVFSWFDLLAVTGGLQATLVLICGTAVTIFQMIFGSGLS